jgi:zinc transporter ZupT
MVNLAKYSKKDKVVDYLDKYRTSNEEMLEQNFKSLFAASGKISNLLVNTDSKITLKIGTEKIRSSNNIIKLKTNKLESLLDKKSEKGSSESAHQHPLTPYLLLLALSIHACFEGIALGLQKNAKEIFYMLLAIVLHKWVEALSIGINLFKSSIDRNNHFKFILIFSLMTPIGILSGMLFSGLSEVLEAIFLSISAGTFIYISASEVVIEEFSVSKFKFEKICGFLSGAFLICILTMMFEHHHEHENVIFI